MPFFQLTEIPLSKIYFSKSKIIFTRKNLFQANFESSPEKQFGRVAESTEMSGLFTLFLSFIISITVDEGVYGTKRFRSVRITFV